MTVMTARPKTKKRTPRPALAEYVCQGRLARVSVKCSDRGVVQINFLRKKPDGKDDVLPPAEPWVRRLLRTLNQYLNGEAVSFDEVPLDLTGVPSFRRRVLQECMRIPYGQTTTYTELAVRAGNPSAVRAAGSAMSHNPIPIVIPCHRVLRSDGGLGGYSAPGGIDLKRQLLEMERGTASED